MSIRSLRGRTALVSLAVVVLVGLTFAGCLGPAVGDERIASYDVTAVVREDRTVAVREVLDWDFGADERRGIYRLIPSSGGVPEDIEVSSPTAPDDVQVSMVGDQTEVRVGDPAVTISGRHRYVLTYVLPDTIVGDRFALDAIGTELEVGSERATVTVLGAELATPRCFTGPLGSTDRCDVEEVDGGYVARVDDLDDHEGITLDGDVVATRAAALPDPPPFAARDASARVRWALVVGGLATVAAAATFLVCRQRGRNEVAVGGATAAAFDGASGRFGPAPAAPSTPPPPVGGVELVADTRMAERAGIEFVPPGGVEPWQAAVVLREAVDARTVGAWFSGLAAHDVVTFDRDGAGTTTLLPGPRAAEADPETAAILNRALGDDDRVVLGAYDPDFAGAWGEAGRAIDAWVLSSGVFRRRPPRYGSSGPGTGFGQVSCVVPAIVAVVIGAGAVGSLARTAVGAVLVALGGAWAVGLVAYLPLSRGLSAHGSAIALRAESFRRFLHDSEARHVEWAWQNGLLREYSAWAVALGEADAWGGALSASSVPPAEVASTTGVLYPAIYAGSFSSTTSAPAPSGGSGGGFSGGGFSGGGFSGGGGGGGGGGSW